ncbi:hypothetical protein GCM10009555_020300 [Acrocarpospora macrocephala]|uniref:Transposase DDE domain-containing protein n=1 Tax=Acrocarpospora macrocephala TaxID=150177 RepID=A0A5M3WI16_9ACTN|nr:hypothetical protein Amac_015650 [Acrocarpospora macrocephala]
MTPCASSREGPKGKSRNLVERCFAKLKQWRAIATRFDKLASRISRALSSRP